MKKYYFLILLCSLSVSAQLQWRQMNMPVNEDNQRFDDIFFLDENLGWAANGAYAAIYKTTDGGQTWVSQLTEGSELLPGDRYFRSVEFLNENVGFVGTLSNDFLRTTDGGNTWTILNDFDGSEHSICSIDAVGTSTVYGCGAYYSPAYMIKSTDSGQTWQYTDMSAYAHALVEVMFVDENTGYVAGNDANGGVILKTTDGGTTWDDIYHSNVPGEYVWKLQSLFSNPNVIVGAVEGITDHMGKLIRSLDNGENWITNDAPESIIQGVGFISETHGWMGGHTTGFMETTDGGQTWTNTGIGNNLNRIQMFSATFGVAAGASVYKFSYEPLATTPVKDNPRTDLKASIEPNPVKDKLSVRIEFRESDHLRLELFDVSGRLIKELQKDNINSKGTKTYTFDFPYAKGTYFVSIHTNTGKQAIKFVK
jgi:photosystem II stability/assembly factor-like uncharacterized protein